MPKPLGAQVVILHGQTRCRSAIHDFTIVVVAEAVVLCEEPNWTQRVYSNSSYNIITQPIGYGETGEFTSVESADSSICRKPHVALMVLGTMINVLTCESVFEIELGKRRVCLLRNNRGTAP